MPDRKSFLLRLDPETFAAVQRWAADDLRSVNGQVEFLLRRALTDTGRLGQGRGAPRAGSETEPGPQAEPGIGPKWPSRALMSLAPASRCAAVDGNDSTVSR